MQDQNCFFFLIKKSVNVYLSEFMKRYLQKFEVRFNNLTLEFHKNQLKVAS